MHCALVETRGVVLHLWNAAEVAGQKLNVPSLFSNWSPSPSPMPRPFQGEGRLFRPFGERIKERVIHYSSQVLDRFSGPANGKEI